MPYSDIKSSLAPLQKGLLLIVQLRKKLLSDLVSQSAGILSFISFVI